MKKANKKQKPTRKIEKKNTSGKYRNPAAQLCFFKKKNRKHNCFFPFLGSTGYAFLFLRSTGMSTPVFFFPSASTNILLVTAQAVILAQAQPWFSLFGKHMCTSHGWTDMLITKKRYFPKKNPPNPRKNKEYLKSQKNKTKNTCRKNY